MALLGFASGVKAEPHSFAAIVGGYKCLTCPAFMTDADVAANNSTTAAYTVGKAPEWLNVVYKAAGGTTSW